MESEDVLILGVDTSAEIVCLGKKRADKGKGAADPSRRQFKKSHRDSKQFESCLVILDDSNNDSDYVEMYGGDVVKDTGLPDSGNSKNDDDLECLVSVPKRLKMFDSAEETTALESGGAAVLSGLGLKEDLDDLILTDKSKPAHTVFSTPPTSTLPLKLTGTSASLTPSASQDHHLPNTTNTTSLHPTNYPKSSPSWEHQADKLTSKSESSVSSTSEHRHLGGHRTPTCWTNCPNCPPNKKRKYHLIDVAYNSAEWSVVSNPLCQLGFTVTRVQRIQNELLWQRLCFEKQLMLSDQRNVNEQLLYHTSRCSVSIICEEGLDARLSMNGNFGRGMYFSDSPYKCNCYWSNCSATSRYMFCCRVLLGDVKIYPKGKCEQLMREPSKVNPKPGESKFYDSVMGNLSGQNEFVVYNNHRVMPEYVLEYAPCTTADAGPYIPSASHVINHVTGPAVRLVAGVKHLFHPTGTVFGTLPATGRKRKRKNIKGASKKK